MKESHTYFAPSGEQLTSIPAGRDVPKLAQFVHSQFRALVSEADFPCVGARAAFRATSYRFGMYGAMGEVTTTRRLAEDLRAFLSEQALFEGGFASFVATFVSPLPTDESHFELLVWAQLQQLNAIDHDEWDPTVSDNPAEPGFEFSFGGRAFFIVGLHPGSSRWSRRFGWPTLVFNAHEQFERLRLHGKMERFQETIRRRDTDLQGSINPNLADFGVSSGARQYSGRHVEPEWICPFHAQRKGGSR